MDTYEERFAYNIKRFRQGLGLTQRQFADRLGYSEKTVSKWECTGAVPGIATLYKIATLFNTNIDSLFCDNCTYLLGIDGGGTKTDFVLADEEQNVLKEVRLGGCNPIDIGLDNAKEILKKGINEVCEGIAFSNVVMFAGISGGSSGGTKNELEAFFKRFGFMAFSNGSDTQNIVSAGIGDSDGVIIIMGTGNCAIAQHDGIQERVSGWGYLFEDGGSGYSISRDALTACFCDVDGSGSHTDFTKRVLAEYGDAQNLLGALYDGGKKFIASFCPIVFDCAEKGDWVCKEIIKKNMVFAANVIKTAASKVKGDKTKVFVAGSLSGVPMAMEYLTEVLKDAKGCELNVLGEPPVKGALVYAKKILNEMGEK